jgi:hypothetical protein
MRPAVARGQIPVRDGYAGWPMDQQQFINFVQRGLAVIATRGPTAHRRRRWSASPPPAQDVTPAAAIVERTAARAALAQFSRSSRSVFGTYGERRGPADGLLEQPDLCVGVQVVLGKAMPERMSSRWRNAALRQPLRASRHVRSDPLRGEYPRPPAHHQGC